MTYPQPGPRPGPPPGGFRPGPPPGGGFRPPVPAAPVQQAVYQPVHQPAAPVAGGGSAEAPGGDRIVTETGHPAVDAVLQSLANATRLAPGAQIAEYEAAHQVLQETLASIDG